jgi:cell division protein FtsB
MRPLIAFFALALVLLQYRLWASEDGLRELWQLEAEIAAQSDENARLAARNATLEAEVIDLKQGRDAAEERARSELGMVREDETFYQVVPMRRNAP